MKLLMNVIGMRQPYREKQLNWDYPPCVGFRKRYEGRIVACLKNAIGSVCPICDPNPYNQKGYFKK